MADYEYLVLEGGGMKGIAYCGALEELEERGILDINKLKGVGGSSFGAIIACLIVCGYTVNEITDIIMATDFTQFKVSKNKLRCCFKVFSRTSGYGIYKSTRMYSFLGDLIRKFTGSPDTTFLQLYNKTGVELHVTGTNVTESCTDVFSYKDYPDKKVRDAVLISISFPFVFDSVNFDNCTYIDGGLLNNYPLNIFDTDEDGKLNNNVLGIKLVSNEEIYGFENETDGVVTYSKSIINSLIYEIDKLHQKLDDRTDDGTIKINTLDYGTFEFDMDQNDKEELIEQGIKAVKKFIKRKN